MYVNTYTRKIQSDGDYIKEDDIPSWLECSDSSFMPPNSYFPSLLHKRVQSVTHFEIKHVIFLGQAQTTINELNK